MGGTGISITAKNEGNRSYSHKLDVIPVLNENDISISTYNTGGLGFIASVPKFVNSIKFCIEIGENKIYSEAINSDYKKTFIITKDILDDLKEYGFNNYNGEMTLTIYEISVIDAYKNIITYNFNYSCSLYNVIK